jgi:UDP-N-acetylmuramoyl-L-alanyl-D-glutamate--2,6-diaminopimelate ligase
MDGAIASHSSIPGADLDILGLSADSREVRPGYLFAALAGSRTDGRRFVADAVARGAAAILVEDAAGFVDLALRSPPVRVIADPNPRRRLALMAARFFAPQPKTVVAVTGTNGKTSVADFTRQIWRHQGQKAASLGTIGIIGPGFVRGGGLTCPDPVTLHRELQGLARAGIDHVALEASSHGLDQHRLDGLVIAAAAFTNLSRDHLDYHRDLAAYFAAKARLFAELLPAGGSAILNADAPEGARLMALCRGRRLRVLTFGRAAGADIRLVEARPDGARQVIAIDALGEKSQIFLPLLGSFQAANALAALGLALATGTPLGLAVAALEKLQGVPGRMERVAMLPSGAPVIVDYAHTPDALEAALLALRPHCRGRLVLVFGCGGDRDPGKRPQMGAIAAQRADLVIVTDDNPRGEDPREIRRAILAQCKGAREIGDRAAAIGAALDLLAADDVLLIAGKGHESGQIVGGKILPFNDAEAVRLALAARAGGSK